MNTFGRIFRVSIFGESHGPEVGVLIDGCPAGLPLDLDDFTCDLGRRRGGGAAGTTPRKEDDIPFFRSGLFEGKTTGAPLQVVFKNENVKSADYSKLKETPRPGHADWVAWRKFGGFNDYRGGGHFSGRLTVGLVVAGVIAKKLISPVTIESKVIEVGGSPDVEGSIRNAMDAGDSVGGLVECQVSGVTAGLGEPFFDSLESLLAHAIFSVPAVKGIEFGAGFGAASMRGSQCNDEILDLEGKTATNNAGGINGGISNGNLLTFRVAIKPTSSIRKDQNTVNFKSGEKTGLSVTGRHDACIALRAPVVIEAATALVLCDLMRVAVNPVSF